MITGQAGIEFSPLPEVSVFENAAPGENVTQVEVQDGDSTVVYSIVGGNVGTAFSIGASSGIVEVSAPLDFETVDRYFLTIRAVQTSTGSADTAVLTVNVLDVNERPFFVTECAVLNNCEFNVSEVADANTPIATIVAGDPDRASSLNGMIIFSIMEDVPFTVVQTGRSAEIQTSSPLPGDRFTYIVTLVVSDVAVSIMTRITVRVIDVNNNAPVFVQPSLVLSLPESTSPGTIITQYVVMDADEGTNAEIVFSISSKLPSLPFSIAPNGSLYLSAPLDFEQQRSYIVNITASNPDGLQATSIIVAITVFDVNDNPPVFSQEVYTASVVEHALEGTVVMSVRATDADSGQLDFSIVAGNIDNVFVIDQISSGIAVISVAPGADINREELPSYELTVVVRDQMPPILSDTARVIVTVLDINDNSPDFLPDVFNLTVRENVVPPFDIVMVFVFDLDAPSTPNTQVDFQITSGNVGNVFILNQTDNNTAVLQLVGMLNFETQPSYRLILTATDRGTNPGPLSSTATVNIQVTNVITMPPVVNGNQTIKVQVGTDGGTPIAVINATDADGDRISYRIVSVMSEEVTGDAAQGLFSIDDNGVVSLARRLDFATRTRFEVIIEVSDGISTTPAHLVVVVVNGNQFPPNITAQAFSVLEEQTAGTIVGTVLAIDIDAEPSENISFSIVNTGRVSTLFSIESETGVLRTSSVLDREMLVMSGLFLPESNSSETITVQAEDGGTPSLSSTAEITITLIDVNDNAPTFLVANNTVVQVFENTVTSLNLVNNLTLAQDADLGINGMISYSLEVLNLPANTTSPFSISDRGEISTTMPLDREVRDTYSLLVQATDSGDPPLSTVLAVTIVVLDENDNAPNFTQSVYTISVQETTTPPEVLLQVSAFDADTGAQSAITYSIVAVQPSNTFQLFSINNLTGEIVLVGNLDFESNPSHTLTVRAEDGGSPRMSATATVEVTVENVDEIPPMFVTTCGVTVSESVSPNRTPITSCIAIDVDDTTNSPAVASRYELVAGNIGGAFTISNDGTVRVVAPLDRETVDFYSITVQAFDRVGLSVNTTLNITVRDVNDNAPNITNLPVDRTISVASIRSQEREIFSVVATDADIGVNAELVYSIDTFTQLPGDMTNVSVSVADRGNPVLTTPSFLTVRFEQSCGVQQYSINSTSGVITGDFLCSAVVSPQTADVNVGTGAVLRCSIVQNIPVEYTWLHNGTTIQGPFSFNGTPGELVITSARFQDAGEYVCRASSAAGSLQSMSAVVRIQGEWCVCVCVCVLACVPEW